jgi:hypothetical protein
MVTFNYSCKDKPKPFQELSNTDNITVLYCTVLYCTVLYCTVHATLIQTFLYSYSCKSTPKTRVWTVHITACGILMMTCNQPWYSRQTDGQTDEVTWSNQAQWGRDTSLLSGFTCNKLPCKCQVWLSMPTCPQLLSLHYTFPLSFLSWRHITRLPAQPLCKQIEWTLDCTFLKEPLKIKVKSRNDLWTCYMKTYYIDKFTKEQDRQCMYNTALRHSHVTTAALDKQ